MTGIVERSQTRSKPLQIKGFDRKNYFCPSLDTRRRPGAGGHPQRNPPHPPYPRRRPVADIIDTERKVLFWYVGFSQKTRLVVVHSDEEAVPNRVDLEGANKALKCSSDSVFGVGTRILRRKYPTLFSTFPFSFPDRGLQKVRENP